MFNASTVEFSMIIVTAIRWHMLCSKQSLTRSSNSMIIINTINTERKTSIVHY